MSQEIPQAEVYLITCGPGTEIYSVYGHSALRIVIPEKKIDTVYNWGVFDFATPNFAWKFAKGRLNYMLGVYSFESFLKDYFLEKDGSYLRSSIWKHLILKGFFFFWKKISSPKILPTVMIFTMIIVRRGYAIL